MEERKESRVTQISDVKNNEATSWGGKIQGNRLIKGNEDFCFGRVGPVMIQHPRRGIKLAFRCEFQGVFRAGGKN